MTHNNAIKNVLTIAGSDPSGGAGVQADLKTMTVLGAYGMAALTSLTAQNTQGVQGALMIDAGFVADQLRAVFSDVRVDAVKTGMLGDEHVTRAIADVLHQYRPANLVMDPVLVSTSGHRLTSQAAVDLMISDIAPLCTLVTPNIAEAQVFLKAAVLDAEKSAQDLYEMLGGVPVLLKGGDRTSDKATDILCDADGLHYFTVDKIETRNTHGTGCTLSAAIATYLAQGLPVKDAIAQAKDFLTRAIAHSDALNVGSGYGPVNHLQGLAGGMAKQ